ncbi:MAG: tetratricopeptide repeat protein, partial [Polyangiales bacterium]
MHQGAFIALKELYTAQERWDDLQALYRNRIAQTSDPKAKEELLLQVCFLFEEILEDPQAAILAYQDVLELHPSHRSARRALERLYRRVGRWRDLLNLLRQELEQASGQDAIELTFELGRISEDKLSDFDQAVSYYDAVLQENPTHLRSQEALRRLLEQPSQRLRVAGLLEPLYEAQGAWSELAHVLQVQLGDTVDLNSRAALLKRVAKLQQSRLRDNDAAFAALAAAVEADPGDGDNRHAFAMLAQGLQRQPERAEVLERTLGQVTGDPQLRAELLREQARLWDELGELERAETVYLRLVDAEGDDSETVLATSLALERIHIAMGNHPALAADLRRQIELHTDNQTRAALLGRLAALAEQQLGDPAAAAVAYRERLDMDAADMEALAALERLYTAQSEWQRLIGVLQSRDAVSEDEAVQRRDALRVAEVFHHALGDKDNAIVAYHEVLQRFGPEPGAFAALDALYTELERWDDLLDILEQQHDCSQDVPAQTELCFRMAELRHHNIDEIEAAVQGYVQTLERAPGHAGAIAGLEVIAQSDVAPALRTEVAQALLPYYAAKDDHARLVAALDVIASCTEGDERVAALQKAAALSAVQLSDAPGALRRLTEALQAPPNDEQLPSLLDDYEALIERTQAWQAAVDTLRPVVRQVFDEDLQKRIHGLLARLYDLHLQQPEQAAACFEQVATLSPDDSDVLRELERLYRDLKQWSAVLGVLQRRIDLSEDDGARLQLWLEFADLAAHQVGDVTGAIQAFEAALDIRLDVRAAAGLETVLRREQRWDDLRLLYERMLDAQVGDVQNLRFQLGQLLATELDSVYDALPYFRQVLQHDRNHAPSIGALEALMQHRDVRLGVAEVLEPIYLARMDWPKVTETIEARLAEEVDAEQRQVLLRRLAKLHEEYLEDLDGAFAAYARLFHEEPMQPEVWDTLARVTRIQDNWPRLLQLYDGVLDNIGIDDEESVRLLRLAADLHVERGGESERAARYYQRCLRFDPTATEVFRALERVLQAAAQHHALVELYDVQADHADESETRIGILHAKAKVLRQALHAPERAIEVYREVLDIEPLDNAALDALDELFTEQADWSALAELVERRAELSEDADAAVALRFRLGQLYMQALDDKERAIDVFEALLQDVPGHAPSIAMLEVLVQDLEHRRRITELLEPIYRRDDQWK